MDLKSEIDSLLVFDLPSGLPPLYKVTGRPFFLPSCKSQYVCVS